MTSHVKNKDVRTHKYWKAGRPTIARNASPRVEFIHDLEVSGSAVSLCRCVVGDVLMDPVHIHTQPETEDQKKQKTLTFTGGEN